MGWPSGISAADLCEWFDTAMEAFGERNTLCGGLGYSKSQLGLTKFGGGTATSGAQLAGLALRGATMKANFDALGTKIAALGKTAPSAGVRNGVWWRTADDTYPETDLAGVNAWGATDTWADYAAMLTDAGVDPALGAGTDVLNYAKWEQFQEGFDRMIWPFVQVTYTETADGTIYQFFDPTSSSTNFYTTISNDPDGPTSTGTRDPIPGGFIAEKYPSIAIFSNPCGTVTYKTSGMDGLQKGQLIWHAAVDWYEDDPPGTWSYLETRAPDSGIETTGIFGTITDSDINDLIDMGESVLGEVTATSEQFNASTDDDYFGSPPSGGFRAICTGQVLYHFASLDLSGLLTDQA